MLITMIAILQQINFSEYFEISDLVLTVGNYLLYLTETSRDGEYMDGEILFTSETNNVDVRFTSDSSERRTGFTLDVRSIPCSDRVIHPQIEDEEPGEPCDDGTAEDVVIAAGEVLETY